ncbi:GNAT family N-acetyltransferase [Streptomyces sp. NPDC048057]|uniref:GNAT family N-acetyltransferase n=1 Tax=Streptomyces sp. NPDC048057 TaxID=3155628 RepID=UPI0033D3B507
MTTTLRPVTPLIDEADGTRSRRYDICVNGRSVGRVEIAAQPPPGPRTGVVRSLHVDEVDRRRGRGTVAALAAEEVLRGWGCDRIQVWVPSDAAAATRLVAALGYAERGRSMVKDLRSDDGGAPPALAPGLRARPMTEAEIRQWRPVAVASHARILTEHDGFAPADALARSEAAHESLLAEPGLVLDVLEADGEAGAAGDTGVVGHLLLGRREVLPDRDGAYVYDVEVAADRRGRGYGRALMLHAEHVARAAGASALGLYVHVDNAPARALYTSLGCQSTVVRWAKQLW